MRLLGLVLAMVAAGVARGEETPAPAVLPPVVVDGAAPTYPEDCFRDNVQGDVVLALDIGDDGGLLAARIEQSPDPRLSWAALGAATRMTFAPAALPTGEPVAVRIAYTLTFHIDEVARERMLGEEEAQRLAQDAKSAPVNLRGRVFVAGERVAVAGALVDVEGTDKATVADERGFFEIAGVADGVHTVHVEASGFLPGDVTETFHANVLTDMNVYLEKKPGTQDETVVYGRKTQREVSRRTLTQKELTRVPGTFGDAVRVVQRLPGVSRAPFGLGAVLVRGGAPQDTNIQIDGHQTRILFHLGAGPSVINSDLVERLEFYPGGQGVRYGRAIAGAIDVITREPRLDTFSGKASVSLLETGFRLEGPVVEDKIGFFFAGRRSYVAEVLNVGDIIARNADIGVNSLTLAPRYSDYQAKLLWKIGGGHSLGMTALGSEDSLEFALDASQLNPNAPSNVGITIGSHRFNPVWRFASPQKNDAGEPVLRAFASPMLETYRTENRFDASEFRLEVVRFALRTELELRPVDVFGVVVGFEESTGHFVSTSDLPLILPDERLFPRPVTSDPPRTLLKDDVVGSDHAFYVEGDTHFGGLRLIAGARASLVTYYEEVRTCLDPRFAARWETGRMVTWKGSIGTYHQIATPFQLAKEFGNPDLPLERGVQASLGSEVMLTRSLELDVQLFGRTADDQAQVVVSPTSFFASSAPRVQPIQHQRVYGTEFLLRQQLDPIPGWGTAFGWIAYTIMKSERRLDAAVGIEGAEAEGWVPSQYDQTHILSIAASTQLPLWAWGIEVGGAFRYVTGNPVTLAQSGQFDADTSSYRALEEPFRQSRLPAFVQLDLRVDKKWTFDTWSLAAFLDLQNVTNQQNYELFSYNYDFSQVAGFPGLPILPVFGADASF